MLCDNCGKNNATTHIKQMVNGIIQETYLCDECASKQGYSNFSNGNISDMLSLMFGEATPSKLNMLSCPVCGSTFTDIANSGKAGCTECYNTFYNELLPYLRRVHGNVLHTGKIPAKLTLEKAQTETADTLKEELKRLINEEKFEEAAIIRDKIKDLEGIKNE